MHPERNDRYYSEAQVRSDHLLQHYEITEGHKFAALFVLGSHETIRVTVPSQQIRAIKLIDALWGRLEAAAFRDAREAGKLTAAGFPGESGSLNGRKLLVVGAGAGGLTAATVAAQHGADVMVVDRANAVLDRVRHSKRLLHPRLYEWGAPQDWEVADRSYIKKGEADLPWLDWPAGAADEVANHIELQWEGIAAAYGIHQKLGITAYSRSDAITFHCCAAPETCPEIGGCAKEVADFASTETFVILAYGFGEEQSEINPEERKKLGLTQRKCLSYWDAEQPDEQLESFVGRKVLICGNGDGALNELFRLTLSGFSQPELVNWIEQIECEDNRLELAVEAIERQMRRTCDEEANERSRLAVAEQYLALPSELTAPLDALIERRLRFDNDIILSVRGPVDSSVMVIALASYAFPLNKLILAATLKQLEAKHSKFRIRRDDTEKGQTFPSFAAGRYVLMRAGPRQRPHQPVLGKAAGPKAIQQAKRIKAIAAGQTPGVPGDVTRIPEWTRIGEPPGMRRREQDAYVPRRPNRVRAELLKAHMRGIEHFVLISDLFDSAFQFALDQYSGQIGKPELLADYYVGALRICMLFNDRVLLTDAQFWDGRFMLGLPGIYAERLCEEERSLFRKIVQIRRRSEDRHIPSIWADKQFSYASLPPELNVMIERLDSRLNEGIEAKLKRAIASNGQEGSALADEAGQVLTRWRDADEFVARIDEEVRSSDGKARFAKLWPNASPWNVGLCYENLGEIYRNFRDPADRKLLIDAFAKRPDAPGMNGDRSRLHSYLRTLSALGDRDTIRDWFDRAYNRMTARSQGANVYLSLYAGAKSLETGADEVERHKLTKPVSVAAVGRMCSEKFMHHFEELSEAATAWKSEGLPRIKGEVFSGLGTLTNEGDDFPETADTAADVHLIRKLRAFASVEGISMSIVSQREAGPTNRGLGRERNQSSTAQPESDTEISAAKPIY